MEYTKEFVELLRLSRIAKDEMETAKAVYNAKEIVYTALCEKIATLAENDKHLQNIINK